MEEGVGLQCKIAEVNVKESEGSNEGASRKRGFKRRSKHKGIGFKAILKASRNSREVQTKEQEVFPFLFLELRWFFLKTGINFIKHNILRRFSITALESAS